MEYNSNFELDEAKSILPPADGELRRRLKPKRKLGLKTNLDQELGQFPALRPGPELKVSPRKVLGVVGLHNVPGLFSSGSQVLDGAI